jgi:hypothetical protein
MTNTTIREYETELFRGENNEWHWGNKISIDLLWVATAKPVSPGAHWTVITMNGNELVIAINVAYAQFYQDWLAAKSIALSGNYVGQK